MEINKNINSVEVDQKWLDNAKTFTLAYTDIITIDYVESEFQKSDFTNFTTFLKLNNLYKIADNYVKVKSSIKSYDMDLINSAFSKNLSKFTSLDEFLENEKLFICNNAYYRIYPDFMVSKLIEIVNKIEWNKIIIEDTNIVPFCTLIQLFDNNEELTMQFIILGYSVDLWKLIDPGQSVPDEHKKYFNNQFIGIIIQPEVIVKYQKYYQIIFDKLINKLR